MNNTPGQEGGLRPEKMLQASNNGADGVVVQTQRILEPPPRLLAGPLLSGNLLARFQRTSVSRVALTPGIASLNPGLMSSQPFRAAGLHAGGVKEISPR